MRYGPTNFRRKNPIVSFLANRFRHFPRLQLIALCAASCELGLHRSSRFSLPARLTPVVAEPAIQNSQYHPVMQCSQSAPAIQSSKYPTHSLFLLLIRAVGRDCERAIALDRLLHAILWSDTKPRELDITVERLCHDEFRVNTVRETLLDVLQHVDALALREQEDLCVSRTRGPGDVCFVSASNMP